MTEQRTAWGWGLASIDAAGNTLDVWYPELTLGEAPAETSRPNHNFGAIAHDEADARGVRRMPVFTVSKLDEPIEDAADAYLRLHLLSMRLAKPNTLNLDGIFAKLNNVVWTNYGPFAVDDFALRKLDVMAATRQSGAVLAPPCSGPDSALMPAATAEYRLACAEPAMRTTDVEQFCSWSAWMMSRRPSACTYRGSDSNGSYGTAKHMRRKSST